VASSRSQSKLTMTNLPVIGSPFSLARGKLFRTTADAQPQFLSAGPGWAYASARHYGESGGCVKQILTATEVEAGQRSSARASERADGLRLTAGADGKDATARQESLVESSGLPRAAPNRSGNQSRELLSRSDEDPYSVSPTKTEMNCGVRSATGCSTNHRLELPSR